MKGREGGKAVGLEGLSVFLVSAHASFPFLSGPRSTLLNAAAQRPRYPDRG